MPLFDTLRLLLFLLWVAVAVVVVDLLLSDISILNTFSAYERTASVRGDVVSLMTV